MSILRDRGHAHDGRGCHAHADHDCGDLDGRDDCDRDGHDDHESFSLVLNVSRNIHSFLVPDLIPIGSATAITIILNQTHAHFSCLFDHKYPSLTY